MLLRPVKKHHSAVPIRYAFLSIPIKHTRTNFLHSSPPDF
jgi:hypothetical protein